MPDKAINDPANYRKMCEPFADAETAQIALDDFYRELRELRNKHKIPDMLTVIKISAMRDGKEATAILTGYNGDVLREPELAAYAYGESQANYEAYIQNLATGHTITKPPKVK
jgi:hypothetical protein